MVTAMLLAVIGFAMSSGSANATDEEQLLVVPPCTQSNGTVVVTDNDLQGFDFSETRATGHYEFTADGLHIYTEGAASTDKVAAYKAVNFSIANAGADSSFDYTSMIGPTPGLQLQVDTDSTVAGIQFTTLVGESVYGNHWWSTKPLSGPHVQSPGGDGSAYAGTLSDFYTDYPNMVVFAVGFSLGSGVHGDGVLHSMTIGCTTYQFKAYVTPPETTTTEAPTTTTTVPEATTTVVVAEPIVTTTTVAQTTTTTTQPAPVVIINNPPVPMVSETSTTQFVVLANTPLPATGTNAGWIAAIAGILLIVGMTLNMSVKRKHSNS